MTDSSFPQFAPFDLPGGLLVAVNSNRKMKTVLIAASFVGNLDETVTHKAILPLILRRGTRSLPDMTAINRYLEGLYGASLVSSVHKVGEWHVVKFRLEVVNEKFLPGETGILRSALEFLRELLWDPHTADAGFEPEFVEQEKNNLRLSIESLLDDKDAYASQRLVEEMCRGEPFRLYEHGRVEDIPCIEPEGLLRLHDAWVRDYPLYVYVAGDLDAGAMRDAVADAFRPQAAPRRGAHALGAAPAPVAVGEVREAVERMDVNQAKLCLGFRHGITYGDPAYEALVAMNGVLGAGGFSHSKLFQNVREKASLAYSIHSGLERTKGLLFVSSGISPENYEKARDIILEQIGALKRGDLTEAEIGSTIAMILNANEMLEDNLAALAEVDFTWRLHGRRYDFGEFRERLKAVRREDIVRVAERLRLDTVYLLTA